MSLFSERRSFLINGLTFAYVGQVLRTFRNTCVSVDIIDPTKHLSCILEHLQLRLVLCDVHMMDEEVGVLGEVVESIHVDISSDDTRSILQ